ncbi:MAG: hypothetical protein ACYDD4_07855 [Acidimicrobiales bacterium]
MPWCDTCDRFVDTDEIGDDRTCPTCETPVEDKRNVPWHFKLMIVATVVYLGYRTYQGIAWVVHHA